MLNFKQYTEDQLKSQYYAAKDAYYNDDEPLMSDIEFDCLEEHLIDEYGFDPEVGAEASSRRKKNTHWFPVLSLAKRKAGEKFNINDEASIIRHFGDELKYSGYRTSLKYDGLAFSAQYKNGTFCTVTTRGNKFSGEDITDKFGRLFPKTISINGDCEIRCEAVISWKTWYDKYDGKTKFKHPRNLASGIKNDLNVNDPRIDDLDIIAVDIVTPGGIVYDPNDILSTDDIKTARTWYSNSYTELAEAYNWILENRIQLEYPIDGIVVFADEVEPSYRRIIKKGHNPKDAISVKFPSPKHRTKVTKIAWHLKRTGNYIPRIHFEPFIIDGRSIKQCGGYNYDYIISNGIGVGSDIEIAISNDIIPIVHNVKTASTVTNAPENIVYEGVHIKAVGQDGAIHWHKFCHGISALNFADAGSSTYRTVYDIMADSSMLQTFSVFDIFDSSIINETSLQHLGPNKSKKLLKQIRSVKSIDVHRLIYMHAIDGCGWSMATQIGRKLSGIDHDFKGLTKNILNEILNGATKHIIMDSIKRITSLGVAVNHLKDAEESVEITKRYVLTGSPKVHGFTTKTEFKATIPESWQEVKKLKDADLLITDDMFSTSNKMKQAAELGIEILMYSTVND